MVSLMLGLLSSKRPRQHSWNWGARSSCCFKIMRASRKLHFLLVLMCRRFFCVWYCGHEGEEAGCSPLQFAQKMRVQGTGRWGARLHDTQAAGFLQCFNVCPSNWHDLHLIGFGIYSVTLTVCQDTSSLVGRMLRSNVTRILLNGLGVPSIIFVNTVNALRDFNSSTISISGMLIKQGA